MQLTSSTAAESIIKIKGMIAVGRSCVVVIG